jgi:ribosome-associated toxin RatA of RatAB toxin-antitoxin module
LSRFGGRSSAHLAAPAEACFQVVCDTPRTPEWHQAIAAVEVLESDRDGRTSLVRARIDALITRVEVDLRLTYDGPRSLHMRRESGDLRDLTVIWTFEDLGEQGTLACFEIDFDPGRALSLLAKGPVVARLESLLAAQPPEGLRQAVEAGAA